MTIIDISESFDRIMMGRENGENIRKRYNLDTIEDYEDVIVIKIKHSIWSLNSSFFVGCFIKSIEKFGEQGFRQKYIFDCQGHIEVMITDGIKNCLRKLKHENL